MFGRLRKKSLICNGNQRCSCMSTKTMTKPDNEASPAMYADRNKKWMPIIIEAVKEMPTLFVFGAGHLTGPNGVVRMLRDARIWH